MFLIADSGSTKTDWRLVGKEGSIQQFRSSGTNPSLQTKEEIIEGLDKELLTELDSSAVEEIFFYGAGCSSDSRKAIVRAALKNCFKNAAVYVEHDLLAACRAVCGDKKGMVAILGTGASTCYYDSKAIKERVPSLGYALGDEGSGAHLGKTLLTAYLYGDLPKVLSDRFHKRYPYTFDEFLDFIYKKKNPNRFLASMSPFIHQNIDHPFIMDIVIGCFDGFFEKHICKYARHRETPLRCVGSVAFYYSNILKRVGDKNGVVIDRVIEKPISGLTLYHMKEKGLEVS